MNDDSALDVTLLCKVVDNYGDIGFVYRLARALSSLENNIKLRLVVSNLKSFSRMLPCVNSECGLQKVNDWTVLDWNDSKTCADEYKVNPPEIILECFQCGRPEWLEDILFDKERKDIVHILDVEYLTAEEWADEFHLLKSGTRSSFVKKVIFMPGFTNKTAGLILDEPFMKSLRDKNYAIENMIPFFNKDVLSCFNDVNCFKIMFFSYPRDFAFAFKALERFIQKQKKLNPLFTVKIFAASGISSEPLLESYNKLNKNCDMITLPYLPQINWDSLLTLMDFSFIRGEDSFSRACLSGVPFVWHAYAQEKEFQLIKTDAVLKRMEKFFSNQLFSALKKLYLSYNRREDVELEEESLELWKNNSDIKTEEMEDYFYTLLDSCKELRESFRAFSESLINNGDLAVNLLNYIKQLQF